MIARYGQPLQKKPQNCVKIRVRHSRDRVWEGRKTARRYGRRVVAHRPRIPPTVDLDRKLVRPRIVELRVSRSWNDRARSVQAVFEGNDNNRPLFPHFRQQHIFPEITPKNLPDLRGRLYARLNPSQLLWLGHALPLRASRGLDLSATTRQPLPHVDLLTEIPL